MTVVKSFSLAGGALAAAMAQLFMVIWGEGGGGLLSFLWHLTLLVVARFGGLVSVVVVAAEGC